MVFIAWVVGVVPAILLTIGLVAVGIATASLTFILISALFSPIYLLTKDRRKH
jgi:hypothetical protein